jgi:hypothetical protein
MEVTFFAEVEIPIMMNLGMFNNHNIRKKGYFKPAQKTSKNNKPLKGFSYIFETASRKFAVGRMSLGYLRHCRAPLSVQR